MAAIKIRLGVAADPSLRLGFKMYEDAARRAARVVQTESARSATAQARAENQAAREKQKALSHVARVRDGYFREQQRNEERAARQAAATQARAARQTALATARAARVKELTARREEADHERTEARKVRATERSLAQEAKIRAREIRARERLDAQSERSMERRRQRFGRDMGGAFVRDSGRLIGAVGRGAVGTARGVASGYGIDTSIAGNIGASIDTHATVRRAVLSGMQGVGKSATSADMSSAMSEVEKAADTLGVKSGELARGLEDFVSASGDLEGAKKMLVMMGEVAQASGADMQSILHGGGFIWKSTKGTPEQRAEQTSQIMSGFAIQGARGNVELKETSQYINRYLASAGQFQGNFADNALQLGALGQFAMVGGRVDAAEATNSAAAFGRDLRKKTTMKKWNTLFGEEDFIFADPGRNTMMKDPKTLITALIKKTGGNLAEISRLMPNSVSAAPALALADTYNKAGGGSAGEAAMEAMWKPMLETMSRAQVHKDAGFSQNSPEAAAARMSNEFEKVASAAVHELTPAIKALTPHIKDAAKFVAEWVSNIKNNPTTAIGAALSALILKSGAEAVIRDSFTSLFTGAKGGGPGAAAPLAVAVVLWTAGKLAIDSGLDNLDRGEERGFKTRMEGGNAVSAAQGMLLRAKEDGTSFSEADYRAKLKALVDSQTKLSRAVAVGEGVRKDEQSFDPKKANLLFFRQFLTDQGSDEASAAKNVEANKKELAAVEAAIKEMNGKLGSELIVRVSNASEIGGNKSRDGEPE